MPPFVPLADGAQVEMLYLLDGQVVENRLWFVCRQPPIDQDKLQALSDGCAVLFRDQLLPFLSSDLQMLSTLATDWTDDPAPFVAGTVVFTSGSNSSGSHSANVAIRVRFKGSSLETWRQNSNFIAGIPKDQVTLNTYSEEIKDGIFEAYVALIDAASGFGDFPAWRWVVTSQRINNAPRTEQAFARMDFVQFPSPYTTTRRKRLPA